MSLYVIFVPDLPDDIVVVDRGTSTVVMFRMGLSAEQRRCLADEHLTAAEARQIFPPVAC